MFPLWQVYTFPPIAAGSGRFRLFWMKEERFLFARAARAREE